MKLRHPKRDDLTVPMWFKSWYAHPVEVTESIQVGSHFHWVRFRSLWVKEIPFLPGQYLNTDFHTTDQYKRRSYTPVRCSDGQTGFLIQNFGGVCSSELCALKPGSVFRISGASGKEKRFDETLTQHITFVAFGSGISFGFSLLSLNKKLEGSSVLFVGSKTDADSLTRFAKDNGLFFKLELAESWNQVAAYLKTKADLGPAMGFYLSGDGQKISFAEQVLTRNGISSSQLFKEIYYNHTILPDPGWSVDEINGSSREMN